jgi:hypothetical protein
LVTENIYNLTCPRCASLLVNDPKTTAHDKLEVTEYRFIALMSNTHNQELLIGFLNEGWELYGSPFVLKDFAYQAVIKREEVK